MLKRTMFGRAGVELLPSNDAAAASDTSPKVRMTRFKYHTT
jgi:hypothetical protein